MALEEVLDRRENWRLGRHSGDYWVCVFGDPAGDDPWSWRFEGHHLSVTMTVHGADVSPAPVFLGANPAAVYHGGRPVSRPLGPEEDLAAPCCRRCPGRQRAAAVCAEPGAARHPQRDLGRGPADDDPARRGRRGTHVRRPRAAGRDHRAVPGPPRARPGRPRGGRIAGSDLYFAWAGPAEPGTRHYYRIQGDDLLIEYDNTTSDGNHAHTVLRRPRSDFGADILAIHHEQEIGR